jgi:hypothetical protein
LASEDWHAPPKDLHSLIVLPNGSLAGADGLNVLVSEVYQPHAWPKAYRHALSDPVVGLAAINNVAIVLTKRAPYALTGSAPASMTITKIGSDAQACVAKQSIAVDPRLGVLYASPDGLCMASTQGVQNVTAGLLNPDQWRAYRPDSMRGAIYQGWYYGFFDTGDRAGCLALEPHQQILHEIDVTAEAAATKPQTGELFLARDRSLVQWDAGDKPRSAYRWRSKVYELAAPSVFGAARVRAADTDTLTLRLFDGDALLTEIQPVIGLNRLPVARRARSVSVELEGTGRLYDVAVAERVDELGQ